LAVVQGEHVTTPYQISTSPRFGLPDPRTEVTLVQVVTPPPETPDTVALPEPSSPTVSTSVLPLVGGLVREGLTELRPAPVPENTASWTWTIVLLTVSVKVCVAVEPNPLDALRHSV